MSYILDALKKLEREKERVVSPQGIGSLKGNLYLESAKGNAFRSNGRTLFLLALVLMLLAAGVVYWFVMLPAKEAPGNTRQLPHATMPVSAPVVSSQPVAAVPTVKMVSKPNPEVVPVPVGRKPSPVQRNAVRKAPRSQDAPTHEVTAAAPVAAKDLVVSGIAWQEERAARRTVINGFLLKEGSSVGGAVVGEILPDKVRFSSPAGYFELRMNTAAPMTGH